MPSGRTASSTDISLMTLQRIDALTGQALFRLWGLDDWPPVAAEYLLFDGCIVAALMPETDFIDVHMAGKPGSRHRSRAAGEAIIARTGDVPLRLIIKKGNRVVNLAKRLGFTDYGLQMLNLINGGPTVCNVLWRY